MIPQRPGPIEKQLDLALKASVITALLALFSISLYAAPSDLPIAEPMNVTVKGPGEGVAVEHHRRSVSAQCQEVPEF